MRKKPEKWIQSEDLIMFLSGGPSNKDISSGTQFDSAKQRVRFQKNIILDLLWNESKSFWRKGIICFGSQQQEITITYSD